MVSFLTLTSCASSCDEPEPTAPDMPAQGMDMMTLADGFQEDPDLEQSPDMADMPEPTYPPENICDNDLDDNNDGRPDCADPSCAEDPACAEIPESPATTILPLQAGQSFGVGGLMDAMLDGPQPIQREASAQFHPYDVSVVRGEVHNRQGQPLAGVRVEVRGQEDFGYTLTRADGGFDFLMPMSGRYQLQLSKPEHLKSYRHVRVKEGGVHWIDDVSMTRRSATAMPVAMSDGGVLVGDEVQDQRGVRTPIVYMSPNTEASFEFEDGRREPVEATSLTIRMTEYTSGEDGLEAMPGDLPPTSAYTYAVEVSADEADEAGAEHVHFNQAISLYVANFLDFPVGSVAPLGLFDPDDGWVPEQNGIVFEVLSLDGGTLALDLDGDKMADDLTEYPELEFTADELSDMSAQLVAGKTYWRVRLEHFTPCDINMIQDAALPRPSLPWRRPSERPPQQDDCQQKGSVIDCQSRSMRDEIDLQGAPYSLWIAGSSQDSNRVIEVEAWETLKTNPLTQQLFEGAKVSLNFAGHRIERTYSRDEALEFPEIVFTPPTEDAWGRSLFGQRINAEISITYFVFVRYFLFPYDETGPLAPRFAAYPQREGSSILVGDSKIVLAATTTYALPVDFTTAAMLPNLDVHHRYEPESKTIVYGNGTREPVLLDRVRTTLSTQTRCVNCYEPPLATPDETPLPLDFNDDATLSASGNTVRLMRRIPMYTGGSPEQPGSYTVDYRDALLVDDGDGQYRVIWSVPYDAQIFYQAPRMSADGRFAYVVKRDSNVFPRTPLIERIDLTTGQVELVYDSSQDEILYGLDFQGELSDWQLLPTGGFALLYKISSRTTVRIVEPHLGRAQDVINTRNNEEILYEERKFSPGSYLGVDDEGRLYIHGWLEEPSAQTVAIITGVNAVEPLFGTRASLAPTFDPVDEDTLLVSGNTQDMQVAGDGTVFLLIQSSLGAGYQVVEINELSSGVILGDRADLQCQERTNFKPNDCKLSGLERFLGVRDDRSLVLSNGNAEINLTRRMPWNESLGGLQIPSRDHKEIYLFDWDGKILATYHGHTGKLQRRFDYDEMGQLLGIDEFEHRRGYTQLAHDEHGRLAQITAPGGYQTSFNVTRRQDSPTLERYSVTHPAGTEEQFEFDELGRLVRRVMSDSTEKIYTYESGALVAATRQEGGGSLSLGMMTEESGEEVVTFSDARGLTTTYRTSTQIPGEYKLVTTHASGALNTLEKTPTETIITGPTGVVKTLLPTPDTLTSNDPLIERGLTQSYSTTTPAGKRIDVSTEEEKILGDDPTGPLQQWTRKVSQRAGRTYAEWITSYDSESRTLSTSLPTGVTFIDRYDEEGRLIATEHDANVTPTTLTYDADGRLTRINRGVQSVDYEWDEMLMLSKTDALGARYSYTYDDNARLQTRTTPTQEDYTYGYDAMNRTTSLRMPKGGEHRWTYNALGERTSYTPPGKQAMTWTYEVGDILSAVSYPDGRMMENTFDPVTGLLTTRQMPEATTSFSYDDTGIRPLTLERAPMMGESVAYTSRYDGDLLVEQDARFGARDTYSVQWEYDDLWHVSARDVEGHRVIMTRDDTGRLTELGDWDITRQGPAGAMNRMTRGNISHELTYNERGYLVRREIRVNNSSRFSYELEIDATGRPISQEVRATGQQPLDYGYDFDLSGRLTQVTRDGAVAEEYTWDEHSNLTQFQGITASYDEADEIVSWGEVTVTHDVNGRIARLGDWLLTYDTRGNLILAEDDVTGTTITYSWDAYGRLASRTEGGQTHRFMYNNQAEIYQVTQVIKPSGALQHYLYDEMNMLIEVREGFTVQYVAVDSIGSPRALLSSTGTLQRFIDYDAFGQVFTDSSPQDFIWIGFAGGLLDPDVPLIRFGHRHYAPQLGRWIKRDPSGFEGSPDNLYGYVRGNPITYRDPTGLFCIGGSLYVGGGIGGSLCFGEGNTGVCVEAGLGLGGGLDVQPFGEHPGNVTEIDINAKGSIGPGGFDIGTKINSCGKTTFDFNGNIGPVQVPIVQSQSGSKYTRGAFDGTLKEVPLRGKTSLSIEAKVAGRRCRKF